MKDKKFCLGMSAEMHKRVDAVAQEKQISKTEYILRLIEKDFERLDRARVSGRKSGN